MCFSSNDLFHVSKYCLQTARVQVMKQCGFWGAGLFQRVFMRLMCFAFWKVTLKCILLRIPFPRLNTVSRCNETHITTFRGKTKQNQNKICTKTEQSRCKVFCCSRQIKIAVLFPYQYSLSFKIFHPALCSCYLFGLWQMSSGKSCREISVLRYLHCPFAGGCCSSSSNGRRECVSMFLLSWPIGCPPIQWVP